MKYLHSIKNIEKTYNTGEEPVLVSCNDHNSYICKYTRYSGSANKLICELLGAVFATDWMLNTPEVAIVKVKQEHVPYEWISRVRKGFTETLNTAIQQL